MGAPGPVQGAGRVAPAMVSCVEKGRKGPPPWGDPAGGDRAGSREVSAGR